MGKGNFPLKIINWGYFSPYRNMAIDEALLTSRREDNSIVFRVYGWKPYSVSIGFFQSVEEINLDYLRKKNIPFVRRPTGGKGVYHANEITYSIVIPSSHEIYKLSTVESFKVISRIFLNFLTRLGFKPQITKRSGGRHSFCFSSSNYYEISIYGKKIVGSAQRRKREGILQHGSIPISLEMEEIKRIFYLKDTSFFTSLDRYIPSVKLQSLLDILISEVKELFGKDGISYLEKPEEGIIHLANKLEKEKYSTHLWNYKA